MTDADDRAQTTPPVKQPTPPPVRAIWGVSYIERKVHERKAKKQAETPADRAARVTANATVWIAAFTVVMGLVSLGTLCEIIEGGSDTHDLAVQAKRQADKMKDMSDAADKIRQAAEGMVTQEQRIADNAKDALDASNRQSKTALDATIANMRSQLDEMKQQRSLSERQFEASQRPWIVIKSVSALLFKWQPYMGSLAFNLQPKIVYTNIGNYPADGIWVTQKLFFAEQTPAGYDFLIDVTNRQKELCETESKTRHDAYVQRVYPSHDGDYSPGLGLNPPTPGQVRQSDRIIAPVLIGCIFYHYIPSPTIHYTGFIFVVKRKPTANEGTGQASYTLTFGEDVAPSDVVFADAYNGSATYN